MSSDGTIVLPKVNPLNVDSAPVGDERFFVGTDGILRSIDENGTIYVYSPKNASAVAFTPNGDITAINVQDAIVAVRDSTDSKLAALETASADVIQVINFASLPFTGRSNVLYITADSDKLYRWNGTAYTYITSGAVFSVNSQTGTVVLTKSDIGLSNVDNTSDVNKPVSTAQQAALDLKANIASPTFTGTVSGITASMVGLTNVDNTSDANKPISTATQSALDLKAPIASPTFTGTVSGISASMVGLGNVDNTSDANKPVSTAQSTAIGLKADIASPTFTGTVSGITATMVGLSNVANVDTTTTANITDATNKRFVTDTELAVLANTSGTNTGDQDLSSLVVNTRTVNGHALSADVTVTATDLSLGNVVNLDTSTTANITDSTGKRFVTDSELTVLSNTSGTNTGDQDLSGLVPKTTTVNGHALSGNISVTKTDLSLGNVDNTSDVNKPVSTATQTALNTKVDSNAAITGATKTKITYDTKGLVTAGTDASLNDLSDIIITSPVLNDILIFNGSEFVNDVLVMPTSAGSGVNYFLTATASGITGYDLMSKTPDAAAEVDESISVTNQTLPFESYISDTALGTTQIDPGLWTFNIYSYVSSLSGSTNLSIEVYSRTVGGTETLLFSQAGPAITSTIIEQQTGSFVQPAYAINDTDLLVFKFLATTTSLTPVTVHLVHSGNTHYSNINTPLITRHNDLAGVQGGTSTERYHLTSAQLTDVADATASNTASTIVKRDSSGNIGVGGIIATSLFINGLLREKITTVSANYTVSNDAVIFVDASTAGFVLSLPSAALSTNVIYTIIKVDSTTNQVVITPNGTDLINGQTTEIMDSISALNIISNGVGWFIF